MGCLQVHPKNRRLLSVVFLFISSGIKGLYRGYGASILTYTPSSAIWWSMYPIYKKFFLSHIPHNPFLDGGIVALSGILAGKKLPIDRFIYIAITAGIATQPLDVAKTRLQVQEHHHKYNTPPHPNNIFGMMRW